MVRRKGTPTKRMLRFQQQNHIEHIFWDPASPFVVDYLMLGLRFYLQAKFVFENPGRQSGR